MSTERREIVGDRRDAGDNTSKHLNDRGDFSINPERISRARPSRDLKIRRIDGIITRT